MVTNIHDLAVNKPMPSAVSQKTHWFKLVLSDPCFHNQTWEEMLLYYVDGIVNISKIYKKLHQNLKSDE